MMTCMPRSSPGVAGGFGGVWRRLHLSAAAPRFANREPSRLCPLASIFFYNTPFSPPLPLARASRAAHAWCGTRSCATLGDDPEVIEVGERKERAPAPKSSF